MRSDQSLDHDVVSDDEGSTECLHPRSRAVPNLSSLFDNCFEDQIASSDEDGNKARNNGTASQPSKVQAADGGCLNPKVRIQPHRIVL